MARALRIHWANQQTVGILLPPSVGGVLVNLAATLAGRTTVNLNYTAGRSGMESSAKQSGLDTIVTSQLFIEKAGLELPEGIKIIWIDEVRKNIGRSERIKGLLLALFAPIGMLERVAGAICRPQIDDLATIIFSSGSTGEPKGVMLSHFSVDSNVEGVAQTVRKNIGRSERIKGLLLALFAPIGMLERVAGAICRPQIDDLATIIFSSGSTGEPKGVMLSHFSVDSNVEGVAQVFHMGPNDRLLGILPFFHSFGYLATIWLAANHGIGVVYHPTPLDAGAIGELIQKKGVTLLIATPTFLQLYLRRCTSDQFGSVRVVLTGAEKLSERLAQAFDEKFGIRPIEGYGVSECSPVISVNCPDFRASGFYQPASRRGTVGQPLPGVSVRIVDPETFAPLPVGSAGMLLVKGPNVMQGYLNRPDLTGKAMHEGWYITGDIAMLDEDGFITITDRLSRFAKIGGEMVPHGKVEEALLQAVNAETQVLAVTSIPDEKKGEQLVVLHTLEESGIPDMLEKVAASGLPNLFIPRKDAFIKVDQIPVLGTGKLDLRALKRVAIERMEKS